MRLTWKTVSSTNGTSSTIRGWSRALTTMPTDLAYWTPLMPERITSSSERDEEKEEVCRSRPIRSGARLDEELAGRELGAGAEGA